MSSSEIIVAIMLACMLSATAGYALGFSRGIGYAVRKTVADLNAALDALKAGGAECQNPMISAAIAKGKDATGLCTVRDWAEMLHSQWNGLGFYPDGEMEFVHNGKKYLVEMKVIDVEDAEAADEQKA